jgi:hypothetical protein
MKQITILSNSSEDVITSVTETLAMFGVNIESISGENYGDQAVVIVTVDNYYEALKAIHNDPDLQVMREDALLLKVKDEIGALARVSRRFADAHINIRSIRFVERHEDYALIAVSTERTKEALDLVKDILVG